MVISNQNQQIVSSDALLNALKAAATGENSRYFDKMLAILDNTDTDTESTPTVDVPQTATVTPDAIPQTATGDVLECEPLAFKPLNVVIAETTQYDGYLSAAKQRIFDFIGKHQQTIIKAPTRAGKSVLFTRDFADYVADKHPNKTILFINSLRATTDQLQGDVRDYGGAAFFDDDSMQHQIKTYDRAARWIISHKDNLSDVILVIDEIHELIKAGNFRAITAQIGENLDLFYKVVGLSGTPFGVFNDLGFRILECKPLKPNLLTTTFTKFGSRKDINSGLTSYLSAYAGSCQQKVLVFVPTAAIAEKYAKLFSKYGYAADFICSENKKDSETYSYILNNKRLPDTVQVVFTTSVLESGFTLSCDRVLFLNGGGCDVAGIHQSISRNTTDGERFADIFHLLPQKETEIFAKRFDFAGAKNRCNEQQAAIDSLNRMHVEALNIKDILGEMPQIELGKTPQTDAIIFNSVRGTYQFSLYKQLATQYRFICQNNEPSKIENYLKIWTNFAGEFVAPQTDTDATDGEQLETDLSEISKELKDSDTQSRAVAVAYLKQGEQGTKQLFSAAVQKLGSDDFAQKIQISKATKLLNSGENSFVNFDLLPQDLQDATTKNPQTIGRVAYQFANLQLFLLGAMPHDLQVNFAGLDSRNYSQKIYQISYQRYLVLCKHFSQKELMLFTSKKGEFCDYGGNAKTIKTFDFYTQLTSLILGHLKPTKGEAAGYDLSDATICEPSENGFILCDNALQLAEQVLPSVTERTLLRALGVVFDISKSRHGKGRFSLYNIRRILTPNDFFDDVDFAQKVLELQPNSY